MYATYTCVLLRIVVTAMDPPFTSLSLRLSLFVSIYCEGLLRAPLSRDPVWKSPTEKPYVEAHWDEIL